jgi:hypothetical protein
MAKKHKRKRQRRGAQQRHQRRTARSKRRTTPPTDEGGISDDEWARVLRRHFLKRQRQKRWGAVLAVSGGVVIVNHFLEHADAVDLLGPLLSSGAQDVVAGFPIGGVLLLVAAILLGQLDDPPKRSTSARGRRAG